MTGEELASMLTDAYGAADERAMAHGGKVFVIAFDEHGSFEMQVSGQTNVNVAVGLLARAAMLLHAGHTGAGRVPNGS